MKYTLFLLTAGALLLASCTDHKQPSSGSANESGASKGIDIAEGLYTSASGEVSMELRVTGTKFHGELMYNFDGKDRNTGTFEGEMTGDKLIADYTFKSEGITSVRQVVFRSGRETWTEGYGETIERSGKQMFIDPENADFSKGIVLHLSQQD